MDTLHYILIGAGLLGFLYAYFLSVMLDKTNAAVEMHAAANKSLSETYDKLYEAHSKLGKEMDEITVDYNVAADRMKEVCEESQKLLKYHTLLSTDYESVVEDLHVIKVDLAQAYPEVLQHLYGDDGEAAARAAGIMESRREHVAYLKRRQNAE